MRKSGSIEYLIDGAYSKSIVPLLHPDGKVIRLYQHWPTAAIKWWKTSVPLSEKGPNRNVLIQSLCYDLEISREEYISWIDDFEYAGMTLIQSIEPLPGNLHPRSFRDPSGFEMVLKKMGAMLLFELPHWNETAGVTVFSKNHADWIEQQGVALRKPPR